MKTTFDHLRKNHPYAHHLLIGSVVDHEKKTGEQVPQAPWAPGDAIDITLTLNGVELPFVETLQRLEKQHDDLVRRDARKLLEDKLDGLVNAVDELRYRTGEIADKKLGFQIHTIR